jgi:peptidoglycan/xylan/chitin deacetylase (PgdA/CDA1 family)
MLIPSVCALQTRGAILCFHSVTTTALAAEGSAHVSADAFKSFVRVVRGLGEVVPLSELVRRHAANQSTAGLMAITFDDAYAAILTELTDFISRQAVPIAVFAVTDAAATGARFWWDRIEDLYPRVSLDRWRAFETACGLPDAYRQGQPPEHGPLRPLRQWLLAAHTGRWPAELEPALHALEQEVGHQTVHRAMTFRELAALASMSEVELGVHTVSHPVLPLLSDGELRHEIGHAYDALRERFANVLPMLAVPFGLYDKRTLGVARSAGMAASFTLAGRLNDATDVCALPRLCLTRDDTAAKLGLRLLGVSDLLRGWSRREVPAMYPDLPSATT